MAAWIGHYPLDKLSEMRKSQTTATYVGRFHPILIPVSPSTFSSLSVIFSANLSVPRVAAYFFPRTATKFTSPLRLSLSHLPGPGLRLVSAGVGASAAALLPSPTQGYILAGQPAGTGSGHIPLVEMSPLAREGRPGLFSCKERCRSQRSSAPGFLHVADILRLPYPQTSIISLGPSPSDVTFGSKTIAARRDDPRTFNVNSACWGW